QRGRPKYSKKIKLEGVSMEESSDLPSSFRLSEYKPFFQAPDQAGADLLVGRKSPTEAHIDRRSE
ncbi:MAG TPA: hypothetical protein VHO49_18855, partial [Anaerolineales bacterium]|nr:hypothetical protein [Anaerolineales bacterium]